VVDLQVVKETARQELAARALGYPTAKATHAAANQRPTHIWLSEA